MKVYLLTSGEYSDYRVRGILIPSENAPDADVRWGEFRARYEVPDREDYAKRGLALFSSAFYDDLKAAEERIAADFQLKAADTADGFYAWLVRDCGCVAPDDVQEVNAGY